MDAKALYRRCLAYEKLGNLEGCIVDARNLIQLEPNNKAVKELMCRMESCVIEKKDCAFSLDGKIDSMFNILTNEKSTEDLLEKARVKTLIY